MLVFFVLLAFAAGSLCQNASSISTRPRPVQLCLENEEWVKCRTICPPQSCNISFTSYACDPNPKCEPGCDCIKNYLRDNKGVCILNEDCPPFISCGVNEEPSKCKQTCPPQTCDWDPTRLACKPGPCQVGCNCIEGYRRDEKGNCIPERECPPIIPQCPENEEPTACSKNIRPFDSTLTIKCRLCQCITNYVRDSNGVCVPKDKLCSADRNTTYAECPNKCLSTCKNPNGICTTGCRESYGCQCNPGYLQNDEGKCVLPQDCPGGNPCKDNQTFVYCNAGCPTANCPVSDSRAIIACDPPYPCPSGCACKRNYKWDSDKREKCILASDCPPQNCTRQNEVWNSCPKACFTDSCRSITPTICYTYIAVECQPQCVCAEKYRRNDYGICVPISECPPQCGKYEEPTECGDIYSTQLSTNVTATKIKCLPGCRCIEGYVRDKNGVCVQMKNPKCGRNEEPNYCPIIIFPPPRRPRFNFDMLELLTNRKIVVDSTKPKKDKDIVSLELITKTKCPPCKCIKNYIRNKNGLCVPIQPVCGKFEEPIYDCGILYPQPIDISVASKDKVASPQVAADELTVADERTRCRRCVCIKGYVRNAKGICVPITVQPVCGKFEEPIYDCGIVILDPLPVETSVASKDKVASPQVATDDLTVVADERIRCRRCVCIKGYVRDAKGICVPIPPTCGKFEETNFCTLQFPNDGCPPCRCIKGYERDSSGVCVPIQPVCGKFEELSYDCGIILYPQPVEISVASKDKVASPQVATDKLTVVADEKTRCRRCVCIKGYVRDANGICVPIPPTCGKFEETNFCTLQFPNDGCPPCRCIKGYERDSSGVCVPIQPVCGKFEELSYDCGIILYPQPVEISVATKDKAASPQVATDKLTVVADDKLRCRHCVCIKGYVRNEKGICVPITVQPVCGKFEEPIYDCGIVILDPLPVETSVASKDKVASPQVATDDLTVVADERIRCRRCVCIKGYVRDAKGICVPIPPTCGKFEETNFCTLQFPNDGCPPCRCIKGYERDSNGVCVPIRPKCPEFEEPNECNPIIYASLDIAAQKNTTKISNSTLVAVDVDKIRCQPCRCIKNYQRNIKGVCVPIIINPPCGKFEEPNYDCVILNPQPVEILPVASIDQVASPPEAADELTIVADRRIRCPLCKCIDGYVRDANFVCVPIIPTCGKFEETNFCTLQFPNDGCPPCRCIIGYERDSSGVCVPVTIQPECPKYEEPNECAILYPSPGIIDIVAVETKNSSDTEVAVDALSVGTIEKIRCRPCKCIKGYERDSNGVCVPIRTDPQCGKYEELSDCKQECPPQTCAWDFTLMDCKPVPCTRGCNCIKGYKRDENGICIPEKQCPPKVTGCNGDRNASYTECPNQCISSCKNPNAICAEKCEPYGCGCNPGYILSDQGLCILPQDCPGGNPCGQNKTYVTCNARCLTNYCPRDDSLFKVSCLPPYPCPGGCACEWNYQLVSYKDDRCILASECPPVKCTRKNEVYNSCPSACFSEGCGDLETEPVTCNTLLPHICQPRCVCEKKYRRDREGNCIPISDCPAEEVKS